MTDYPDWQQPSANASSIAVTGVPLLALATLTLQQSFNPAAGATQSSAAIAMTQIAYDITVQSSFSVAPATPFIRIQLEWLDAGTSVRVATDTWIVPACTTPGSFTAHGRGQAKGDQCVVHVTNLDGLQTATVTVLMMSTSRMPPGDSWRWDNGLNAGLTVAGWTLPVLPPDESVLGMADGVTIAAAGTAAWLIGAHDGLMSVAIQVTSGALSSLVAQLAAEPSSAYVPNNPLYSSASPPASFLAGGVRAPMRFQLHNNATTSVTVTWGITRVPPP